MLEMDPLAPAFSLSSRPHHCGTSGLEAHRSSLKCFVLWMGCDTWSILLRMDVVLFRLDTGIVLATTVPAYLEMMDVTDPVGFRSVLELPSVFLQRCGELLHPCCQQTCSS